MIYMTNYDPNTLRCTGPSVPSGFNTLDEVTALMGPPARAGKRLHTYPDGVAFSDFVLQKADGPVIMAASAQQPDEPHVQD